MFDNQIRQCNHNKSKSKFTEIIQKSVSKTIDSIYILINEGNSTSEVTKHKNITETISSQYYRKYFKPLR